METKQINLGSEQLNILQIWFAYFIHLIGLKHEKKYPAMWKSYQSN